jgi:hypothetical protein
MPLSFRFFTQGVMVNVVIYIVVVVVVFTIITIAGPNNRRNRY